MRAEEEDHLLAEFTGQRAHLRPIITVAIPQREPGLRGDLRVIASSPIGLIQSSRLKDGRQPVIIPREREDQWLDPNFEDRSVLLELLKPYPSEEMEAYRVSRLVNSSANDLPECVNPVARETEDSGSEYLRSLFETAE